MHKKIGLFFGSFNPVHNGHLIIGNYICEYTDIEEVWFIPSPQNPFKKQSELLKFTERLEMLIVATKSYKQFKVLDIENNLPLPSYTINTLNVLQDQYPENQFVIIMGADNILKLPKWKSGEEIINRYEVYVYPRRNYNVNVSYAKIIAAPQIEISASFIRRGILEGKDLRFFVPRAVWDTITTKGFYR